MNVSKPTDFAYQLTRYLSIYLSGIRNFSVNTIRSYFEKDKLVAEEGCAFRMLINLNERDIRTCHPYGTSSDEAAEHYTSQLDLFLNNEYKQLRPMTYYKQNYKSKMIIK